MEEELGRAEIRFIEKLVEGEFLKLRGCRVLSDY
jgi:hypothetical protein